MGFSQSGLEPINHKIINNKKARSDVGFLLFLIEKRSFTIQKCVGVTREIRYTERADENVIKDLEWFFRYFWYPQK